MPRKVGLGPHIFRIEGLSDGREIKRPEFDDFDPTQRIDKPDSALPRELPDGHELRQREQRQRENEAAQLCEWVSKATNNPKFSTGAALPEPKPPQPKLAHNQVLTNNGLVMTMPRAANAFKCRF